MRNTKKRLGAWLLVAFFFPLSVQPQTVPEDYYQVLRARCIAFGFTRGTESFANCMQKEASRTEQPQDKRAKEKETLDCVADMIGRPTKSGRFSEAASNADRCYSDPKANLQKTEKRTTVCTRRIDGAVVCEEQ